MGAHDTAAQRRGKKAECHFIERRGGTRSGCEGREQCVSLREIDKIPYCRPVADWHSGCNRIVADSTR
jgi:hypothetical protein